MNFYFMSLAVSLLVLSSNFARADYCESFNSKEKIEKAIEILKSNSDGPGIKVYVATFAELNPNLGLTEKGQFASLTEISITSIPVLGGSADSLYAKINNNSINNDRLDLGTVYFLDQSSKKWMNLGIAANCNYTSDYMTRSLLEKNIVPVFLDIR